MTQANLQESVRSTTGADVALEYVDKQKPRPLPSVDSGGEKLPMTHIEIREDISSSDVIEVTQPKSTPRSQRFVFFFFVYHLVVDWYVHHVYYFVFN